MLTRLKVTGFKNLVDVDVHFGPFTCIAGQNGVGKSNLFDAIRFLSALADKTFLDAAKSVRDEGGRSGDLRALFHKVGDRQAERMRFEAEMIILREGIDDLGLRAKATSTFLRYTLELGLRQDHSQSSIGELELVKEELTYIKPAEVAGRLLFPLSDTWRDAVVPKSTRKIMFISTDGEGAARQVSLHIDGGGGAGHKTKRPAHQLPKTVLSATNASESPTALLARREMQSWRLLQLEPSALRKPDEFTATPRLGADGSHLPATLHRLSKSDPTVYEQVAGRLKELILDVRAVGVDLDEKRELLSLVATDRAGTTLPARALSDGTLRFLALSVLEKDPEAVGLICFEEPENGIHPERVPAMVRLLEDIAVDARRPIAPDNPLRQVIVNTHSPLVVQEVDQADLLCADTTELLVGDRIVRNVSFKCMPNTWRLKSESPPPTITQGAMLALLQPRGPARAATPIPAVSSHRGGELNGRLSRVKVRDTLIVRTLFDHLTESEQ